MLNRVVIAGRLVRDPESRKVGANGNSVTSFTIAVDNVGKLNEKGEKTTSFFSCVAWGATADNVAKYTRKGLLVGVDGRLVQRNFERKDGTKGSTVEINCDSVQFLETKKESETTIDPNEEIKKQEAVNDGLPF